MKTRIDKHNSIEKLHPKLRFPEFEGEWEMKKLGEVAKFSKGKGISKSDISENGINECIRYGELYTRYGEVINDVYSKTNFNINLAVLSEANDVIIPASGETQIDIATASCVLKTGVILGGDLNIIKTNNNGVFLSYYLNNKRKYDIASLSQGISVVHLYSSQLALLELNLPTLPEQQKTASFLTAVDDKLHALKQKHALLEQYKKGVMQQLFSGKLRFKDENGNDYPDWEEKKLGEVCESIKSGKSNSSEEGKFPLYGSTGIIGKCVEHSFEGLYILIARVGANAGTINLVKDKFGVSDNTLVLNCNQNSFIDYLFHYLGYFNLNRLVFGSGQPLITGGQLKVLQLNLPSLPEQTKIASFLSAIDEKINQCQAQIEKTEVWKKGLLQKMFV